PVCPPPLTSTSSVAGSATVIVTVSESTSVGSLATMRALPRTGSQVATPCGVMVTRVGSGLEKITGAFAIGWPCPSSAAAEKFVVVPAMTTPGCWEKTTDCASAPGPTYWTSTGMTGVGAPADVGTAVTSCGPARKTVSPCALMYCMSSRSWMPSDVVPNGSGT